MYTTRSSHMTKHRQIAEEINKNATSMVINGLGYLVYLAEKHSNLARTIVSYRDDKSIIYDIFNGTGGKNLHLKSS